MRKRDIGVALIVLAIAIFLFWFVILGGANPFVPHLNVKITAGVDCGAAWMCWFNEQVKLEYSPSTSIFTISPMPLQWYCGIGGGPKNLEFKLRVENPDNSVNEYRQEIGTCQDIDLVASFKVPLDKGDGEYKLTATVCGSNWWWQWSCITKSATYYYGG